MTDDETQAGLPVYPRAPMQIAFANWIVSDGGVSQIGESTANRTTTMQVDWVLFVEDQEKSLPRINALVRDYRAQGVQRRNLAGQTVITADGAATRSGGTRGE